MDTDWAAEGTHWKRALPCCRRSDWLACRRGRPAGSSPGRADSRRAGEGVAEVWRLRELTGAIEAAAAAGKRPISEVERRGVEDPLRIGAEAGGRGGGRGRGRGERGC